MHSVSRLSFLWLWLCLLPTCSWPPGERAADSAAEPWVKVGRVLPDARPEACVQAARSVLPSIEPAARWGEQRQQAFAAWHTSPGLRSKLALARALFPEYAPLSGQGSPGSACNPVSCLRARLPASEDGALEIAVQGQVFQVRQVLTGDKRTLEAATHQAEATFYGEQHLWAPVEGASTAGQGLWLTPRLEEYVMLEGKLPDEYQARYEVTVPAGIKSVKDAGEWLEFLDAGGVPQLRMHYLVARDATGLTRYGQVRLAGVSPQPRQGAATLALQGRKLVVEMGLRMQGLAAPVVVDPGWSSTRNMASPRVNHTATLLPNGKVLVSGGYNNGSSLASAEVYDPASGAWSATASMTSAHSGHTATLLPNGKVLVAGGYNNGSTLASAEVYDPAMGTWSATASMASARNGHTATLLPSGQVLVVGGSNGSYFVSAEVYDPTSGTWSATASMASARDYHTATLLPNGKVLVAGGYNGLAFASAEVYDPALGIWSATASMVSARQHHTATLLPNGKVLVAGGYNGLAFASAEVYDPALGTWSATASMASARNGHTATLLPNGKVLVSGGSNTGRSLASAEVYDPASGTWSAAASMASARYNHTATLLPNGKVLVSGGSNTGGSLTSAEVYDPASGTWSATASMASARNGHTATLLPSGQVLVSSGANNGSYLALAEVYDPASGTWSPTASMASARQHHTATLLPNGKVLVSGGSNTGGSLASVEVYDPASGTWSATTSMASARQHHTATLLPNGKVLVAGGSNGSYLASAEVYDPASGTWSATTSMASARQHHTATLLPNGKVLVSGGSGLVTEMYDDIPVNEAWRPKPSRPPYPFESASVLILTGTGFRGISEGSGGNSRNSPTNFPLLILFSHEGRWLSRLPHFASSETSTTAVLPALPPGYYLLFVSTSAIPAATTIQIVDTQPPDTSLSSAPPALTNQTTASFVFSTNESGFISYECSLDGATFSACTSPYSRSNLSEGSYTLQVRARDIAGNIDPTPASHSWSIDTTAPETSLASTPPALTNQTTASFSFSASEAGGSYECSLDGAAFSSCTNPVSLTNLSAGPHTFSVRARDVAGNIDPTPASHSWSISTTAPDTYLASTPPALTNQTTASFSFSASEAGGSYECSLDGTAFSPCTSPVSFTSLSAGSHTFWVRVRNVAGNIDPTPASRSWFIDTTAPDTFLTSSPPTLSNQRAGSFSFIASDISSPLSYECRMDTSAFTTCASPFNFDELAEGSHTFSVRSKDAAGNVDSTPVIYSWTVNLTAPISFPDGKQRNYYAWNCSTLPSSGSSWQPGPLALALLALQLVRHRRRRQ